MRAFSFGVLRCTGELDEAGIYQLTFTGDQSGLVELAVEFIEQLLGRFEFFERLPKQPEAVLIRACLASDRPIKSSWRGEKPRSGKYYYE